MISIDWADANTQTILRECLNLFGIFLIIAATTLISEMLFVGLVMFYINSPVMYYFLADEPTASRMIALIIMAWLVILFVDLLLDTGRSWARRIYWLFAYPVYLYLAFLVAIKIGTAYPNWEYTDIAMSGSILLLFLAVLMLRDMILGRS